MKKFYTYLSLGAAAVFSLTFTGCETTEAGGNGSDAKFSVSVVSTGSDNATAVVTSDSENATWYCFVTEDLDTPAANLAEAEAAKLDNPASVLKKGNGSASFSGLTPSTSYRAIVTGLREDGSVYGTPAEDEFKTDRVIGEIEENADWTMSYGGRVLDQTLAVYDVVKCEAASDDEGYFTMVCPVDEYEYYYSQTGVEGFIKDAMEQYQDIIDQYVKAYPDKIRAFIKENGGLSDARNAGIKQARGKYICFVDSEELFLDEKTAWTLRSVLPRTNRRCRMC